MGACEDDGNWKPPMSKASAGYRGQIEGQQVNAVFPVYLHKQPLSCGDATEYDLPPNPLKAVFSHLHKQGLSICLGKTTGNEGALAGSMGPPGWACAQTHGASLVR
ncbi:hypothetical protein NQ315_007876 [Exocentrus adspersus]|uniref:Uncharacterized protein n=1 Tax=Exocentrus adspersus TaxID=1586481 RepID=A0AAV8WAP9_9CUCU|nr:hypothetical protein NQ315_007876 [Exocentrus adspersus]